MSPELVELLVAVLALELVREVGTPRPEAVAIARRTVAEWESSPFGALLVMTMAAEARNAARAAARD